MTPFPAHKATETLTSLAHEYKLDENHAKDLALFAGDAGPASTATPTEIEGWFKTWWGTSTPKYWTQVPPNDLKKLTAGAQDILSHVTLHDGKAEAQSPIQKKANLLFVAAVAAATAARQRQKAQEEDGGESEYQERDDRAQEQDDSWEPAPDWKVSKFSRRKNEFVNYKTFADADTGDYDNHVWAAEQRSTSPLPRKAWDSLKGASREALNYYDTLTNMAVRKYDKLPEKERPDKATFIHDEADKDVAAHSQNMTESQSMRFLEKQQSEAREAIRKIKKTPAQSLNDSKKHNEEADKESEKAKGNRSYEDYMKEKKQEGGTAMPRKEWQSRYRSGSLREGTIRLAYTQPELRHHLLKILS